MTQATASQNGHRSAAWQGNHLLQAWLVLMLAVVFGVGLAAVHVSLSGRIAENKRNESLEKIPGLIWGDLETQAPFDRSGVEIVPGRIAAGGGERTTYYPVFQVQQAGALAGWVLKASGQGYAGKIELLLGLDPPGETITGIFVLEQTETPGLGNKISLPQWLDQFRGQGTRKPMTVVKGGESGPGIIDAVTGATISSRSVAAIVNRTIKDTRGSLIPERVQVTESAN